MRKWVKIRQIFVVYASFDCPLIFRFRVQVSRKLLMIKLYNQNLCIFMIWAGVRGRKFGGRAAFDRTGPICTGSLRVTVALAGSADGRSPWST